MLPIERSAAVAAPLPRKLEASWVDGARDAGGDVARSVLPRGFRKAEAAGEDAAGATQLAAAPPAYL